MNEMLTSRFRLKPNFLLSATFVGAVCLFIAPWAPGWYWSWRTDNPVRRGADLARSQGCLSCHAPLGRDEIANPGSRWGTVPSFYRGNAMMYVKSLDGIRNFIAEGKAEGTGGTTSTAPGPPFRMHAFKDRLNGKEISDLAAFVLASDGYSVPSEGPVAHGAELSAKYGCESCHGVAGSGGVRNPSSFTKSVPGWTGPDYGHLVAGKAEFTEWVLEGRSRRWRENRAASLFLDLANLQMPAFRGVLKDSDVEDIWTYILWLRSQRPSTSDEKGQAPASEANKGTPPVVP